MQTWPALVLLGVVLAPTSPTPSFRTTSDGPPFTSFCRKDLLNRADGELRCNWYESFEAACEFVSPDDVVVQADALLSGPESVGRCGTGEEIVRVTYQ